jgi:eukaryotic-like serine/threonine-protein kinase
MSSRLEETINFLEEHCEDPEETIRLTTSHQFSPSIQIDKIDEIKLIAEGGMGRIFEGSQRYPERKVAIKKSKKNTVEDQQQLLHEAMIVGALEHPNIIPVHQILISAEEGHSVVMKRIHGISFKQKIVDGCSLLETLQILLPVCNAVEYAHSQGIVHRDIKPSNIMIGHFGEVYLLDWGLALNLSDKQKGVVGSPSFMAPEMLYSDTTKITEQTDVYLLGATLHYAITGKAKHAGKNIKGIVSQIQKSQPYHYAPHIPEQLGQLINSACEKNAERRPESVRVLRETIEELVQHWPALQLTQEALVRAFEVSQIRTCQTVNVDQVQSCHQIFTLARQDFEYALRIWPDNSLALDGLEKLLVDMINIHIQQNESAAALLLYSNLQNKFPELLEKIEKQRKKSDQLDPEQQRLLKLGEEHDFVRAQEASAPFAALIALSALLIALWANYAYVYEQQQLSNHLLFSSSVAVLLIVCLLIFYRREDLFYNKAARGMYVEVIGTLFTISFNRLVGIWYEIDVNALMSVDCFIIGFATVSIWPIILAGEWLSIICFTLGVVSMLFPEFAMACISVTTLVTPTYTWYAWKQGAKEKKQKILSESSQ